MHVRHAVVLAAASAVLAAAPAAAHTDLVSSSPTDGADLTTAPQRVTLTFGEDLLAGGNRLVARTADGQAVALGPATVKGQRLLADWPQSAGSGQYRVAYRAVAADGHPLEGVIRFTVIDKEGPAAEPSPAAAEAPEPSPQDGGVQLWAPLALIAALAVAGLFVWRSRAD